MPVTTPSVQDLRDAATRLGAEVNGDPWTSAGSVVAPITLAGRAAFLKVTDAPEELLGRQALRHWAGTGAVRLIAQDGNAAVLEQAGSTMRSVLTNDDDATRAICDVAACLHAQVPRRLDRFPSLGDRFRALVTSSDPRLARARSVAGDLLNRPVRPVLLHGDLHTENILDSGRGWLAIDPKGITGPREFDYGNIFTNWSVAEALGRFDARLDIVGAVAGIGRDTLLRWIVAWSALSAAWYLQDREEHRAVLPLAVMDLASARLTSGYPGPARRATTIT